MRDLDKDIREAFEALQASAPADAAGDRDVYFADYFENLASRIDARLETEQMTAQRKAPRAAQDPESDDLQADIRSLAKATKQRVTQNRRAVSEAEQSLLLSASSTGLRAVALPPPGVDDWHFDDAPDEVAAAREKRSGSGRAAKPVAKPGAGADSRVEDEEDRGGLPVWIYAAVGTVAVAAVVFFVVRGGDKVTPSQSDRVAATAQPEPAGDRAVSGAGDLPAEPVASAGADGERTDPASMVPADPAGPGGEAAGDSADRAGVDTDDGRAERSSGGDEGAETRRSRDDAVAMTRPGAAERARSRGRAAGGRAAGKSAGGAVASGRSEPAPEPAPAAPAATKAPPPPKKAGDHSIDDLLREASGGAAEPSKGEETPKPAAPPAKKELDRDDIKKAMDGVQGKVSACKDKLAEPGMVMVAVRFKVSPGGQVTSADASGKHAGTPVGNCVAGAVKTARFPVISGPPSSLSYSFLLSQ